MSVEDQKRIAFLINAIRSYGIGYCTDPAPHSPHVFDVVIGKKLLCPGPVAPGRGPGECHEFDCGAKFGDKPHFHPRDPQ